MEEGEVSRGEAEGREREQSKGTKAQAGLLLAQATDYHSSAGWSSPAASARSGSTSIKIPACAGGTVQPSNPCCEAV